MPSARQASTPASARSMYSMRSASSSVADAVLGDEHGHPAGHLPGAADGRLERLGPELVAHLRDAHVRLGIRAGPSGPDAHPRVALHAEEVVAARGLQEDVLHVAAVAVALGLAAGDGLAVEHASVSPTEARPGPARIASTALRCAAMRTSLRAPAQVGVALAGREDAVEVAHGRHDVRLVHRAGAADQVAAVARRRARRNGRRGRRSPARSSRRAPRPSAAS